MPVCDEVHTGAPTDDPAIKGADEFHWTPILCVEHRTSSCTDDVDTRSIEWVHKSGPVKEDCHWPTKSKKEVAE